MVNNITLPFTTKVKLTGSNLSGMKPCKDSTGSRFCSWGEIQAYKYHYLQVSGVGEASLSTARVANSEPELFMQSSK